MKRTRKMFIFLFVAAFAVALNTGIVHAVVDTPCMADFEGTTYKDSDCDDYADAEYASLVENLPIDNCPNVKNGNCFKPANCNFDGSYDEKDASTLSETARRIGDQADWNKNGVGDACDDSDGDGVVDYKDNCKSVSNSDQNPGLCTDSDNDGFEDSIDNCPANYNNTQTDSDLDNIGDACDKCILVYNPNQEDTDDDGRGDACPKQPALTPTPSEVAMPETIGYQFGPDKTQGGGGCSMIESSSGAVPSVVLFAAFLAMILFRRNRASS